MKTKIKQVFVLAAVFLAGLDQLCAQVTYKTGGSNANNMKLSGTSTLHKWVMNAQSFSGDAQFGFTPGNNGRLNAISSLSFTLPVQNLKSNEKKLNKNAYEALKTDRFKNILYKLTSAQVSSGKDNKYMVRTQGNLSIAGVTKPVTMDVYCVLNSDATITCTGSEKLKMTDYDVKPPTFMFGSMSTGNDITLDFTVVYKK